MTAGGLDHEEIGDDLALRGQQRAEARARRAAPASTSVVRMPLRNPRASSPLTLTTPRSGR